MNSAVACMFIRRVMLDIVVVKTAKISATFKKCDSTYVVAIIVQRDTRVSGEYR